MITGYLFLTLLFDYEKGWNWENLTYTDFFTLPGFFRNLFFNGFHPVLPWAAFLLTGLWIGRLNLKDRKVRRKTMLISLLMFISVKLLSYFTIMILTMNSPGEAEEINYMFGTEPMPPSIFYMLSGSSLAVFIISISVSITERFEKKPLVKQLISMGQLALTIYIAHVLIGMLALEFIFGAVESAFGIQFIVLYAIIFIVLSILFSHYWRKRFSRGPLEYLMRKITG